ncbi:hypothetical protein MCOR25_004874 [Pyricularia grisea]|nr:hypothetical protein MCOR25_004874 [Pyricularia grisea]
MVSKYRHFLGEDKDPSLNLVNVAHTLANRREHFQRPTFAVATNDKFEVAGAVTGSPKDCPAGVPPLVMPGQAASTKPRFHSRSVRRYNWAWSTPWLLLGLNPVPWSYTPVANLPLHMPRVPPLQRRLSQWHTRGLATKPKETATTATQKGSGGMAVVGLGWDQIKEFLAPGVVAACDNSPSSVTISGDSDVLDLVVAAVKQVYPDVPTTTLKVEQAYHSHHMLAFGEAYYQSMVDAGVTSVPHYWKSNLGNPVLFQAAVTNIHHSADMANAVFLEIGPHSAGPVRQILTHEASSGTSYVPTLVRRQNGLENLLQAIGKLYVLNVPIDISSLAPGGTAIPNLPAYAWDHSRGLACHQRVASQEIPRPFSPGHPSPGEHRPRAGVAQPAAAG